MKVIALTAEQQEKIASLKDAVAAAQVAAAPANRAVQAANQALAEYVQSLTGVTVGASPLARRQQVGITDDGITLVVP
jgi:hypothetical protein